MRDEAIAALTQVRDELRANRLEEEFRQAKKRARHEGQGQAIRHERARGERF